MGVGAKGALVNKAVLAFLKQRSEEAEAAKAALDDVVPRVEPTCLSQRDLLSKIATWEKDLSACELKTDEGLIKSLALKLKLAHASLVLSKIAGEPVTEGAFDARTVYIEKLALDLITKQFEHLEERAKSVNLVEAREKLYRFKLKMMKHEIFNHIPPALHELVNRHNTAVLDRFELQTQGINDRATRIADEEAAKARTANIRKYSRRTALGVGGLAALALVSRGVRHVIRPKPLDSLHHKMAMQTIRYGIPVANERAILHDTCVAGLKAANVLQKITKPQDALAEVVRIFLDNVFKLQGSFERPKRYVTDSGKFNQRTLLMLVSIIKSAGLDKVFNPELLVNPHFGTFNLQFGIAVGDAKSLVLEDISLAAASSTKGGGLKFNLNFATPGQIRSGTVMASSNNEILGLSSVLDLAGLIANKAPLVKISEAHNQSEKYFGRELPLHKAAAAYISFLSGDIDKAISGYGKLENDSEIANYALVSRLNLLASKNAITVGEMLKAANQVQTSPSEDMKLALFETILAYTSGSPGVSTPGVVNREPELMQNLREIISEHPEWCNDVGFRKNVLSAIFAIEAHPLRITKFFKPNYEFDAKHLFSADSPDAEELYLRGLVNWARGENKLATEIMLRSTDPRAQIVIPLIKAGNPPSRAQAQVSVRRTTVQSPFEMAVEYKMYSPQ
jgi:hypothetical protein